MQPPPDSPLNGHVKVEKLDPCKVGISAADLQRKAFAPIDWVVPGYIASGLTLIAGKPKKGKSWLALQAAIAVASGGTVIGVQCKPGDALVCALEDPQRRLQNRMQKLVSGEWPSRLRLLAQGELKRLHEGGLETLREWITTVERPRLIVIDTLAKVRAPQNSRQNLYLDDYQAVSGLKALADEFNVAIVIIHHLRKAVADDPIDTVNGSSGLTGAVDTISVLISDANGFRLVGSGRDVPEFDTALQFDKETSVWSSLGNAADARRSEERSEILEILRKATKPMTAAEVAEHTGKTKDATRQTLSRMAERSEIVRVTKGSYSHPLSHQSHSHDQRDTCDSRD